MWLFGELAGRAKLTGRTEKVHQQIRTQWAFQAHGLFRDTSSIYRGSTEVQWRLAESGRWTLWMRPWLSSLVYYGLCLKWILIRTQTLEPSRGEGTLVPSSFSSLNSYHNLTQHVPVHPTLAPVSTRGLGRICFSWFLDLCHTSKTPVTVSWWLPQWKT